MKVRVIESSLERNDYELVRQRGSHRQYRHRVSRARITVSGRPNDDMTPGQLAHLRRKTGLDLR
jgi:predicted RNA binding protein YcfA (HicA-like mRNA interferase family)